MVLIADLNGIRHTQGSIDAKWAAIAAGIGCGNHFCICGCMVDHQQHRVS